MRFRKKPVVVEAEQWFPGQAVEGVQPYEHADSRVYREMINALPIGADASQYGYIWTLEGGHIVTAGDWIITGVQGEKYPCKPDIFAATYEPAEATGPTPFEPGRYWYTTVGLPEGVRALLVRMAHGHDGVRFVFTTEQQAAALASQLGAEASALRREGTAVGEPPEVPPRPWEKA